MSKVRKVFLCGLAGVALSPLAMAADVDGPSWSSFASQELLSTASASDEITAGRLAVVLGAEFAVTDRVIWTLTGSALADNWPSSVVSECVDETAAGAADGLAGITFGLVSGDENGATYRVTDIDSATCTGATSTVGQEVIFADGSVETPYLAYSAQAVDAAGGVTASYNAEIADGTPLDTEGGEARSVDVWVVASQFAADVIQPFDAVVDVNTNRKTFASGSDCLGNCDTAIWEVLPSEVPPGIDGFISLAFALDQDVTVAADFSWIFDADETLDGIQPGDGDIIDSSCGGANGDYDTLTSAELTATCGFFGQVLELEPDANVDPVDGTTLATLPATSYVSTHVLNFEGFGGTTGSITVVNIPLGAWTLNGFQAEVAYMPFQTGISQVIYIANRSSQSGDITIDWIDQNGESGSFSIGPVEAGSTRAIGPAIAAGLPAAQKQGGRLALTITANVPACQAQLNAQYNVSGDRAFSVADTNCATP